MTDPKLIAEAAKAFSETDFGKHYIAQLSVIYNGLHQDAEGNLSVEQKALKVERAAGLKIAIDFIAERVAMFDQKYFDNQK